MNISILSDHLQQQQQQQQQHKRLYRLMYRTTLQKKVLNIVLVINMGTAMKHLYINKYNFYI
jgi:hypothetical protein